MYEPFGILDFSEGLSNAKEPWLSPANAWKNLKNAFVYRGQVVKRLGYQLQGYLGTPIVDEDLPDTQALDLTIGTPPSPATEHPYVLPKEAPPSTYKVDIHEDGGLGQLAEDQPTNIDFSVTDSGHIIMTVTGETIFPAPSTSARSSVFNGPLVGAPLMGFYDDQLNDANRTALLLDASYGRPAYNVILTDPNRELPIPGGFTISWTLPAPDSVTIPFGVPVFNGHPASEAYGVIDSDGAVTYNTGTHGTLIGGFSRVGKIGGAASDREYAFQWSAPAGTVTVSYSQVVGVIDYSTGHLVMTWPSVPTGDVKIDYEENKQNPVMGVLGFITADGSEPFLALDTEELWRWDPALKRFVRKTSGGTWTGNDKQYYWFTVFETNLLINNGKDHPKKYDPSTDVVTDWVTTYNAAGDEIEAASIAIRDKRNRIVYLDTVEDTGVRYPNRARWTPPNSTEYQGASDESQDDYVDCPTEDQVVTAALVGDDIVVGMSRSWWRLRYDGDPVQPYVWEHLQGEEGASARMSTATLPEQIITRGERAIIGVDGVSERPVDIEIPDYISTWDFENRVYSYSVYSKENRVIYMTFVDKGDTLPNNLLAIHVSPDRRNYSYSVFDVPFHCLGEFRQTFGLTYDVITQPHNTIKYSYNDAAKLAGQPIVVAGGRYSDVFEAFTGLTYQDVGKDVLAEMETNRLNPYVTKGLYQRCHLGYIDIYCSTSAGATMTLKMMENYEERPYLTKTVDIEPGSDKVQKRVLINHIANFHTVRLEVNSPSSWSLDGLILNAKPGGRMQELL